MSVVHSYLQWWRTWRTLPVRSWIKAAGLYRQGEYAAAEKLYAMGLQHNPNHPAALSARLDRAYCLFKQRRLVDSERELRAIISRHSDYREGYMRLARLQLWMGRGADAALTLRRGVQLYRDDIEMNGLLLLCLVEQKSSRYLIHEARSNVRRIREQFPHVQLLKAAEARCAHFLGESDFGKDALQECALSDPALFDSVLAYSELLISEERFNDALVHLRRALQVSAHHPRVLNLLARAYLADTPNFNPEYATQLAISACQNTAWLSVRDLLCLAECYRVSGDKLAALVTAQRANALGVEVRIEHQQGELLQRLIAKIEHELQV